MGLAENFVKTSAIPRFRMFDHSWFSFRKVTALTFIDPRIHVLTKKPLAEWCLGTYKSLQNFYRHQTTTQSVKIANGGNRISDMHNFLWEKCTCSLVAFFQSPHCNPKSDKRGSICPLVSLQTIKQVVTSNLANFSNWFFCRNLAIFGFQ